jgi:hypothetical protein
MKGFLPKNAPAQSYSIDSQSCSRIEEICNNLPKLLLTGKVQTTIDKLSKKDLSIKELLGKSDGAGSKTCYVPIKLYGSCLYLGC